MSIGIPITRRDEEKSAVAHINASTFNQPAMTTTPTGGLTPSELLAKLREAEAIIRECAGIRNLVEVVERNEEWSGGHPTYGTPQTLGKIKRSADNASYFLSTLNLPQ